MTLRRIFALLVALGAVLAVGLPAMARSAPDPREVRLIAATFRQELSQAESYETFRQAMFAHFDTHVAPLLAEDKPNLVVYPERLDRLAMLIGTRGRAARDHLAEGGIPSTARPLLMGPYAPQMAYYRDRFPDQPDARYLQLALSDTIVRGVVEPVHEIAHRAGVHVVAGAALPEYEQVTGPQATLLADPEDPRDAAYAATAPQVRAVTFVVGPDGQMVARRPKVFLERDEASRGTTGTALEQGLFEDVRPVELPFAKIGIAAGRDAWIPHLGARLEQLGGEILVHPLSHGSWADFPHGASLWPPDEFQRSMWLQTRRYPGLRAAATAVVTGNLGARVFDGQSAVAGPTSGGTQQGCLVGSGFRPFGWAAIGPWAGEDAIDVDVCSETSREALVALGDARRQGSGDPQEGRYAAGAVAADITLPNPVPRPRVGRGTDVTASVSTGGEGAQLWPSVSASDRGAWLAWVDIGPGRPRVRAARSGDGGAWSEPDAPWDIDVTSSGHLGDQGPPSIVSIGRVRSEAEPGLTVAPSVDASVVFSVYDGGGDRDVFSSRHDFAEEEWGSHLRVDRGPGESFFGDPHDALRIHAQPELLLADDGTLFAVWSDLRWPYVRPQIRIAKAEGADAWTGRTRLDGGAADPDLETARQPAAAELNETGGQLWPTATLTGAGELLVAWQAPSRDGASTIHLARSTDGGESFSAPERIDGTNAPSYRPVIAAEGNQVWLAWEEERANVGRSVTVRTSADSGRTWTPPVILTDDTVDAAQRNPALVARDGIASVVFEDHRTGDADVLLVEVGPDGRASAPIRVDDGPDGSDASAPDVTTMPDGRVVVAWQDDRRGKAHIRTAVRGSATLADAPDGPATPAPSSAALPATGAGAGVAILGLILATVGLRCRSVLHAPASDSARWPIWG